MPAKPRIIWQRCDWCGRCFQVRAHKVKIGQGRFCGRACAGKYGSVAGWFATKQFGETNGNWKGGRVRHIKGYIYAKAPGHPRQHNGYVLEHILVMEQLLGRYLKPGEVLHHENGKKWDNRPKNLRVFESAAAHTRYHAMIRRIMAAGS